MSDNAKPDERYPSALRALDLDAEWILKPTGWQLWYQLKALHLEVDEGIPRAYGADRWERIQEFDPAEYAHEKHQECLQLIKHGGHRSLREKHPELFQ